MRCSGSGLAASAVAASFLFAGSAGASVLFSENFSGAIPGGGSSAGGAYPTGTIPGTQFAVTEDNVDVLGVLNGTSFSCVDNPAGNCLDLVGNEDGGAIASTTTFDLIAGHTYTVTFGAILQGYAAGQGFTSFDVGLGSQSRLESADGTAQQFSLTFTPPVDESGAQLSFTTVTPGDSVHGAVLDNIVLSGGVPEPAAWATILLGFGLIGTTLRRRRGGALAL